MKITVMTSNNVRHINLINMLSKYCDKLFVIQECKNINNYEHKSYENSKFTNYFNKVNLAQQVIFPNYKMIKDRNKIKIFQIQYGNINTLKLAELNEFLKSDLFIVFGASYIKYDLLDFLIERNAINIHAGISPYYRGTDCNFWALYDGHPHLVGTTIHLLTSGLDEGAILYHAMPEIRVNPFEYTMSSIKSAFLSLCEKIKDNSIFEFDPKEQNQSKEIRFSKKKDFNAEVISNYFKKDLNLKDINFDISLLIRPYFPKK